MNKLFQKIKNLFTHKITAYVIFNHQPVIDKNGKITDASARPLSFATTQKEADEIIERLYYFSCFPHYYSWCSIRDKDVGFTTESWAEYYTTIVPNTAPNSYYTVQLSYTKSDFVTLLRIYSKCRPLYLPHEHTDEYVQYYFSQMDEKGDITIPQTVAFMIDHDPDFKRVVEQCVYAAQRQVNSVKE